MSASSLTRARSIARPSVPASPSSPETTPCPASRSGEWSCSRLIDADPRVAGWHGGPAAEQRQLQCLDVLWTMQGIILGQPPSCDPPSPPPQPLSSSPNLELSLSCHGRRSCGCPAAAKEQRGEQRDRTLREADHIAVGAKFDGGKRRGSADRSPS